MPGPMTFKGRLRKCVRDGGLTISDLARWFDRPRATVNTWLQGRKPLRHLGALEVERDLALLETAVKSGQWFPIPLDLTWAARERHIRGARHAAARDHRVPTVRAAG